MGKKKSKKGKGKKGGGGGGGDSAEAVAAQRAQSELLALRSKLGKLFRTSNLIYIREYSILLC